MEHGEFDHADFFKLPYPPAGRAKTGEQDRSQYPFCNQLHLSIIDIIPTSGNPRKFTLQGKLQQEGFYCFALEAEFSPFVD